MEGNFDNSCKFYFEEKDNLFYYMVGGQFVYMLFFVFLQIIKERKDKVMINFVDERELKKCWCSSKKYFVVQNYCW